MPDSSPTGNDTEQLRRLEAVTDLALSQLELDDLLPELLDRIRDLLAADTAAVLLLDHSGDHLLATAARGLEEEVLQGSRVPIGLGFAGQIASTRLPVVIEEVTPLAVVNPVLLRKGIRSMLGVPLLVGDEVFGVLHVGSLHPRLFSDDDISLLQQAADRAAGAVSQMRARESARAARVLQLGLGPGRLSGNSGLELAARYVPGGSLEVGGDWYDVFPLPGDRLGIAIGDVAGHGVDAAIVMGRLRSALRAYALEDDDPAGVLKRLDRMVQVFEPDQMATVVYLVYERHTGLARISSAGHLPPIIGDNSSSMVLDVNNDPPLGVVVDGDRHTIEMELLPGTRICLYTDGLVERRGRDIDVGIQRLRQLLAAVGDGSSDSVAADVMAELIGGQSSDDDVAMLVLRRPVESWQALPEPPQSGS